MQNKEVFFSDAEAVLPEIALPLLAWYRQAARSLPWRDAPSPYRVWISEVMLQQTRVEAVKPYFTRFVMELPDVSALAEASEAILMKLWEGLGYYSRVRNLQKAARIIAEKYGGVLPASYEQLLELPGFGPYTAGAVASIAFGIPVPAVDGNVLRVVSRLLASREDISRPEVKEVVAAVVSYALKSFPDKAGTFNQAVMELGATICGPNTAPSCNLCPISAFCEAYRQGVASELPVKAPKKARRVEQRTVFLLFSDDRIAIQKRPSSGLLAGLWEFPSTPGHLSSKELHAYFKQWGVEAVKLQSLKPAKHIFSHVEWHMIGYFVRLSGWTKQAPPLIWSSRSELIEKYALPSALKAYQEEALRLLPT